MTDAPGGRDKRLRALLVEWRNSAAFWRQTADVADAAHPLRHVWFARAEMAQEHANALEAALGAP